MESRTLPTIGNIGSKSRVMPACVSEWDRWLLTAPEPHATRFKVQELALGSLGIEARHDMISRLGILNVLLMYICFPFRWRCHP